MRKVIFALFLVTMGSAYGAMRLYEMVPESVGTAVIAEKPQVGVVGGQAAVLLPADLTPTQGKLLTAAYDIAKADGHQNPEILQAILLQETHAGQAKSYRVVNPGPDAYFGMMQLKLGATKEVLGQWPELFSKFNFQTRTDEEIKASLILNDRFNIAVASKYLMILHKRYGFSGHALMVAYNKGPGGAKNIDAADDGYAQSALTKLAARKAK